MFTADGSKLCGRNFRRRWALGASCALTLAWTSAALASPELQQRTPGQECNGSVPACRTVAGNLQRVEQDSQREITLTCPAGARYFWNWAAEPSRQVVDRAARADPRQRQTPDRRQVRDQRAERRRPRLCQGLSRLLGPAADPAQPCSHALRRFRLASPRLSERQTGATGPSPWSLRRAEQSEQACHASAELQAASLRSSARRWPLPR